MSEDVIHNCIQSIPKEIKIVVVDNSRNNKFKESLEKKYENIICILSSGNIGMGAGNNLGLSNVKTDYALILNPDVTIDENTIDELLSASKTVENFSVMAPLVKSDKNLNYKLFDKKEYISNQSKIFKVKSVDGFAMLLNLKKLLKLNKFKKYKLFDENIFLYLENDDLCTRLNNINENIYIASKARVSHIGGGAVNKEYSYQIELSRNWHWVWSKFYFNKKHKGYFTALIILFPTFLSAILKYLFYSICKNKKKKDIYLHRALGYINALLGKKSSYRPEIKIDF
tara:strand:+ start:2785 stop:3639 length:855 start_codon:yes stop_codon:yes gene_type:complete